VDTLLNESRNAFKQRLAEQKELNNDLPQKKTVEVQVDDVIDLPLFKGNRVSNTNLEDGNFLFLFSNFYFIFE
jgi:23S rRNA-/tRNA-specific pseudouridylate synthase